ncbi:hypothetical protein Q5741_10830 [Paenibacillus sp. JX-17]|uniref:Uncharacterized protein n=1 Tax=Paenibacillus lacisoli TaxID=3064525 RepID=A0ABT9CDH2_9BACL|nr:hypothetical protein [Paenibacillus sp. JX-17]MDO7906910.1 hypothetical protein [Paenibacillus sp. JX-17]
MLENERYGEAMNMLRFLLQCQGQEKRHYEEWEALLQWLETAFPQYIGVSGTVEREEEELSEEELARRAAQSRKSQDAQYEEKMLRRAMEEPLSEQTMLALDQLSYLEHPDIDQALMEWLQNQDLHPLLQFRILQTLRRRGTQGTVSFRRAGEDVQVEIEDVPLQPADFPEPIIHILERVADQTEVHEPTLFYFAQELWSQFVMAVYGTRDYDSMLTDDDLMLDIWAAALHQTVSESLGTGKDEEETRSLYGITGTLRFRFEQAHRSMKQFVSAGLKT